MATWSAAKSVARHPFRLGPVLGRGRYGLVHEGSLGERGDGRRVAIKVVNHALHPDVVRQERKIFEYLQLNLADAPGIVASLEFFQDHRHSFFLMDRLEGGELFEHVKHRGSIPEREALALVAGVADSLALLHGHHIIHRDIKPENLVYAREDAQEVVLTDFGFAHFLGERDALPQPVGTFGYTAPEVLRMECRYGRPCDVFSLGCVLYVMLYGELPFPASTDGRTSMRDFLDAVDAGPRFASDGVPAESVSEDARELVRQLVDPNPLLRPGAESVAARARAMWRGAVDNHGAVAGGVASPVTESKRCT